MEQNNDLDFLTEMIVDENVDPEKLKYVEIAKQSSFLDAVKAYKDDHNCGLKEAKERMDSWIPEDAAKIKESGGCIVTLILLASSFGGLLACFLFLVI